MAISFTSSSTFNVSNSSAIGSAKYIGIIEVTQDDGEDISFSTDSADIIISDNGSCQFLVEQLAGTYNFTITATSASESESQNITVTVV